MPEVTSKLKTRSSSLSTSGTPKQNQELFGEFSRKIFEKSYFEVEKITHPFILTIKVKSLRFGLYISVGKFPH